jgi:hypothetical protein
METDLLIKPSEDQYKLSYNGRIKLNNFQIGPLLNLNEIQQLSLEGTIDGKGIDKNAIAEANIDVSQIKIAEYFYYNSHIEGTLENKIVRAEVYTRDSIFTLDIDGSYDFSDTLPKYNFNAQMQNGRIGRLLADNEDSLGLISGKLAVNVSGNSADNITGDIYIDSLYYLTKLKLYQGDSLHISSAGNTLKRSIHLRSKFLDGDIDGAFRFVDLDNIYGYIIENFIPSLVNKNTDELAIAKKEKDEIDLNFSFNFNFKETSDLTELFLPQLQVAQNTILKGRFNEPKDTLFATLNSKSVSWDNNTLKNLRLNIDNHLDTFDINIQSDAAVLSGGVVYDSVLVRPKIYRDSAQIELYLGKVNNHENSVYLQSNINFIEPEHFTAEIARLSVWINDTNWTIKNKNFIEYKEKFLLIEDILLAAQGNSLSIDGKLSQSPKDHLDFNFQAFDLKFFNYYMEKQSLSLGGNITGDLSIANIWDDFNYSSEFVIDDFVFNGQELGETNLMSNWNMGRNAISINMTSELKTLSSNKELIELRGFYYPKGIKNKLDLKAKLKSFPLKAFEPFVSSFSSKLEGTGTGTLYLQGDFANIILTGGVHTEVSSLAIDYLNTSYSVSDSLVFTPEYFGFNNVRIKDRYYEKGNNHTGLVNFRLYHNGFKNMRLDLKIEANELEALNTKKTDNELFYGKAITDGSIQISGPFDDLYFNIDLKPRKGTKVAIPMSESASVQSNDFITFVLKDSLLKEEESEVTDNFEMSMDMRFDMTPEATVQLVMDETVGDIITANGEGILRIHMDKEYNIDMFGSYKIVKGDYLFTMQNIINKHFILSPGGSITWEGDLMDARVDMSAIYETEAKLYDLLQMYDTSDVYKRRSKVNCIIDIDGSLASPQIRFDIGLPEEDNETQEKVKMVLYTGGNTNQDLINKNFISLLMLNTFQAPGGFAEGANPNALASNATEMLASQVSNWLNKMSDEVDIGLTWDMGDEATSQEIAVALSYQAFNDRLLIDTKVGRGGEAKGAESETRIVGDVNVEYAITKDKNLRAKAFNRTNYDDPLTRKAPYTQGAGFVYRKEFDSLAELFYRRKKEQSKASEPLSK